MMKFWIKVLLLFLIPGSASGFEWVILKYKSGDWYNARPSVQNLLNELEKRTTIQVEKKVWEFSLDDERIFRYSFLFLNGHIPVSLNEKEKTFLRRYVLGGGFIFINDDFGIDKSVREILAEVFPDHPLKDVPTGHPVYHIFYDFPQGLPKIHEHEGHPPRGMGIFVNGRLSVFYAYSSDIADGWDDESVHNDPPALREQAFRMGVNIIVYALSR